MITKTQARDLLDGVLEELALCLGGIHAMDPLPEAALERLMRCLEVLREKALVRLADTDAPPAAAPGEPYPAIQRFLEQLGRG